MRTISITEFHAELKAQTVALEDLALICPMCHTVQSARDFISAGAGDNFDAVERFIGFSCIGRFVGASSPRKEADGRPCNWTLGGLFKTHHLEVVDDEGKRHPRFEPATPEQAHAHAQWNALRAGPQSPGGAA